jgi:hypothetical protein
MKIKLKSGIDINSHPISTKSNKKEFQIPIRAYFWDVPHAEYNSNLTTLFEEAHGVIILFDLTNSKSIQSVDQWRSKIPINMKVLLVANKSDKRNHVIAPNQLDSYVKKANFIGWYSTSSLNDQNVQDSIDYLIDSILIEMLKKFNGLPLERVKLIKVDNSKDSKNTEIEEYDFTITDSDTDTDYNFDGGIEESIEMNMMFENEKTMGQISLFIEELKEFYSLILKRLRDYEKMNETSEIHLKFLSLILFELEKDHLYFSEKVNSIQENYSNLFEHSIYRNFIQLKREFYSHQIEKWKRIWNNLKLELKLNQFGFKSDFKKFFNEFRYLNGEITIESFKNEKEFKFSGLDDKIVGKFLKFFKTFSEDEEIFPTIKSSIQHHEMINIEAEESFFHSIGKEIKN